MLVMLTAERGARDYGPGNQRKWGRELSCEISGPRRVLQSVLVARADGQGVVGLEPLDEPKWNLYLTSTTKLDQGGTRALHHPDLASRRLAREARGCVLLCEVQARRRARAIRLRAIVAREQPAAHRGRSANPKARPMARVHDEASEENSAGVGELARAAPMVSGTPPTGSPWRRWCVALRL